MDARRHPPHAAVVVNGRRLALLLGALALAAIAITMPTAWYDALPRQAELPPPPVNGANVLRVLLAMQAFALAVAAAFNWEYVPRAVSRRGPLSPGSLTRGAGLTDWVDRDDLSARAATWLMVLTTALALALRCYHADSDLWLDEISPILDYGALPVPQIVGSYLRSNNHLLNTLLLKGMIALFGEHEWSVRIPAIVFGTAGVPLTYWCARLVLSRRASIGAALLLAVSYHDVLFSQNARGYTAYLAFALLSTRLLIDALREDRLGTWTAYVAATVLGFASLLNTAFVLAAHGLVSLAVMQRERARGEPIGARVRRLFVVFGIAGFLSLELYSVALPQVYVVITNVYKTQSTGFVMFSREFLDEIVRGVTAGFGTGALIAAVPFLLIAGAGFVALLRRSWALAGALALPGLLTALFLVVRSLTVSPRFFLLWLPCAIITAVVALDALTGISQRLTTASRHRVLSGTIALLAVLSAASLMRYYRVPKQPYRAAVSYVEQHRASDDLVIVVYLAELGVRYYGPRTNTPVDAHYRYVRTMPDFDAAVAAAGSHKVWLVVTFERALQMDLPDINARIRRDFAEVQHFPATIGDGAIGVWAPR